MSDANKIPAGLLVAMLLDKDGNLVEEINTPVIIKHTIEKDAKDNDVSTFTLFDGKEVGDLREGGYTLVPLEDVIANVKKGRDIRFFQNA